MQIATLFFQHDLPLVLIIEFDSIESAVIRIAPGGKDDDLEDESLRYTQALAYVIFEYV